MKECFCIGPQDGQPLCPCRMRNVQVKDGRYVEMIDRGPAPSDAEDYSWVKLRVRHFLNATPGAGLQKVAEKSRGQGIEAR